MTINGCKGASQLITLAVWCRQCCVVGTARRIVAAVRNGSAIRLFARWSSYAPQSGSKCPTTLGPRCAYRRHGGKLFVAVRVRLHSATLLVGTVHRRTKQEWRLIQLERTRIRNSFSDTLEMLPNVHVFVWHESYRGCDWKIQPWTDWSIRRRELS